MPKSGQPWDAQFLLGHPLFAVFEPLARTLRGPSFPSCEELTRLAEKERESRAPHLRPLRFVEAHKKPRRAKRTRLCLDELYDGSIHLKGEVPCLSQSYHDLFNALAFSAFVRSKRVLHQRQFEALERWIGIGPALPGRRTREQDALTIFDEGGVVVLLDAHTWERWQTTRAPLPMPSGGGTDGAIPLLFGHALVEHLYDGHAQLRASAVVLKAPPLIHDELELLDRADEQLAARLLDRSQFTEPGADAIFIMDADGRLSLGPPKPSWTAWNPGDKENFSSHYR